MKKTPLKDDEVKSVEALVASEAIGIKTIRKIVEFHVEDLKNIENIDPKGNMGLEAKSRQVALGIVRDIFGEIFPDLIVAPNKRTAGPGEKEISKWA